MTESWVLHCAEAIEHSSVLVFHPGRQHAIRTAEAFHDRGMLAAFCTSLYTEGTPSRLRRFLNAVSLRRTERLFSRYEIRSIPEHRVVRYGNLEILERACRTLGLSRAASALDLFGNMRFGNESEQLIKEHKPAVVVAFNNSALEIFEQAKYYGATCVLEQTTCHPELYNSVMAAQAVEFPDYFGSHRDPVSRESLSRQRAELEMADLVVVGSEFAKESLVERGVRGSKVRVVEYGHGFPESPRAEPSRGTGPTKFVFVGAVGLRKGCHLLIETMRLLADLPVTLNIIGPIDLRHIPRGLPPNTIFKGKLGQDEVRRELLASDCFVFPSLFEGSAIALKEAQAVGLPLIQTEAAGAGCTPGVNGLFVEPTVSDLEKAMRSFAQNRELRAQLIDGAGAHRSRPWDAFKEELVEATLAHLQARSRGSQQVEGGSM